MKIDNPEQLLDEQVAYYRARAGEYDEWFYRRGRYDRGAEANANWFAEIEQVRRALDAFGPTGDVLELACGTGLWTERLVGCAEHITAVDASPEVLALNRRRVDNPRVEYVQADLFTWRPTRRYDTVFFGFWLSHVPPGRFEAFWEMVGAALAPGGRVFFVDSLYEPTSSAVDHRPEKDAMVAVRRLNDGQTFRVVKVFYEPAALAARLAEMGWQATVRPTEHYVLYGEARRQGGPYRSPEGLGAA